MSKSIGNTVDPLELIEGGKDQKKSPPFGADVLRLWVASVDFQGDVLIGPTIMTQVSTGEPQDHSLIAFQQAVYTPECFALYTVDPLGMYLEIFSSSLSQSWCFSFCLHQDYVTRDMHAH